MSDSERSWLDIGHGVSIEVRYLDGESGGVGYRHPRPDGRGTCEGWAPFSVNGWPKVAWQVESLDPLTIYPSLFCRACGHHGFIRQGRWVPA